VIDDVIMTSHLSGWSWSEYTARNKPRIQGYHFCEYRVLVGAYTRSCRVLCGGI